ncbi:MAG TPA: DinB family protein [Thermoanaerobaculia bacterium]|nr:DinB family protein [Thermoanaerobaculia bacterium]
MNSMLEEVIEAWEGTREGIIAEVDNIPPKEFAFRASPKSRSVAELVQHIMEVSLMMAGELTREDTNFRRAEWPKLLAMYSKPIDGLSSKRELLSALRSTLRDGVKAFRGAGELHMLQFITRFDGKRGTRLAWFNHGVAHENYHQGQLALYQRLIGITPALTKLIQGGE